MIEEGLPWVEELCPAPDVLTALRICADWPDVLLLESALLRDPVGRYSFLMADPYDFMTCQQSAPGVNPLDSVQQQLARTPIECVPDLPPFQGGAAGYAAYDLGRTFERLPAPACDEFEMPVCAAGLYDWVVAWDHLQRRAWIVSQGLPETDRDRRRQRAQARAHSVRTALSTGQPHADSGRSRQASHPQGVILPATQLARQWPAAGVDGLTSNFSRDGYLRIVDRAIEYIHAGDIFQVNLSQRLLLPQPAPPLELYARLRARNPAPFAGYFAHADWALASASPERFLHVRGNEVETRPIKGTRRRRSGPEADLYTRDELRESEKDQAENVMIVDLLRNDLSRVCLPGSVRVPHLCRVETYETVQHLVSEVRGLLEPGRSAWDLFPATFPGGSITGAPKVRAMQIIAELEPTARGAYCGSLFYVGYDGCMDSSLLIRTFTVRRGWVQCPVGGGIVAQSSPAAEFEETLHKAEGMLRAVVP